jgi:hypothetical protein
MKNEGALTMRFFRHGGIYRSDVSLPLVNLGRGTASRSGSGQAIGRAGKNTPSPSSAMSSGRLFLDRVARQHCPSPLHRHHQNKALDGSKGTIYHRTVNSALTVCLTPGGPPHGARQWVSLRKSGSPSDRVRRAHHRVQSLQMASLSWRYYSLVRAVVPEVSDLLCAHGRDGARTWSTTARITRHSETEQLLLT